MQHYTVFLTRLGIMVFSATFNDISFISWRSDLLVGENKVPGESHRPTVCHWQTLSDNVANAGSTTHQVITSHNTIIFATVNVLKTCIFAENNQHIKTLINMRCVIKACNTMLVLLLRLFHQQNFPVVKALKIRVRVGYGMVFNATFNNISVIS
jgi:hypothetical protein